MTHHFLVDLIIKSHLHTFHLGLCICFSIKYYRLREIHYKHTVIIDYLKHDYKSPFIIHGLIFF